MSKKKKNSEISPQVWTAIITTLGVIIVALFAFPPFQRIFDPEPSPTTTPTITPSLTLTQTLQLNAPAPNINFTDADTPTLTLTSTFTPIPISSSPTSTIAVPGLLIGMQVKLNANQTSGKVPLKVKLDARDSFFRDAAGNVFPCGACTYTWYIREGSDDIYGPEKGEGTFDFTFGRRGTFYVSVYVCRSGSTTDCGGSGTMIVVK